MPSKVDLIEIPLPVDRFDVVGATVTRVRRISFRLVRDVRRMAHTGDPALAETLAKIYPRWEGVVDCDDGETPLQHLKDNPQEFFRLDYADQVTWLIQDGLNFSPRRKG